MALVIELLDGPLAGTIHEVAAGFPIPNKLKLEGHWYDVDDDEPIARYAPETQEPSRD